MHNLAKYLPGNYVSSTCNSLELHILLPDLLLVKVGLLLQQPDVLVVHTRGKTGGGGVVVTHTGTELRLKELKHMLNTFKAFHEAVCSL